MRYIVGPRGDDANSAHKLGREEFVYITLFDLLSNRFNLLTLLPRWKNIGPHNRALIVGLLIVIVLLLLCGTAVMTSYHYVPLIVLGVFCGGVIAKALSQFLAPKIQSHVTA